MNIAEIFTSFKFDFWTFWGIIGQSIFFFRLVIQWFLSEKANRTIIPFSFWWLGLIGAIMIFIYAWARKDIVFLITGFLQIFLYSRNLRIATK